MTDKISEVAQTEIEQAIFSGRKIEAIKIYRAAAGVGLKEAKEAVETLTSNLRLQSPDKFSASSSGCGTAAAVLIALAAGVGYFLFRNFVV